MSEPDDFLSRWSRRKRAAADAIDDTEARTRTPERTAEDETPNENTGAPAVIAVPAPPPFDVAMLPSIESITAATDIRPFLAPGVPSELVRAALRRAWRADPNIRDFVGLADYDWDFRKPGSMTGFGPLEMTDELRKTVARFIGDIPDDSGSSVAPTPLLEIQAAEIPSDTKAVRRPSPTDPVGSQAEFLQIPPIDSRDIAGNPEHRARSAGHDTAVHQPAAREITASNVQRRHGRALPK